MILPSSLSTLFFPLVKYNLAFLRAVVEYSLSVRTWHVFLFTPVTNFHFDSSFGGMTFQPLSINTLAYFWNTPLFSLIHLNPFSLSLLDFLIFAHFFEHVIFFLVGLKDVPHSLHSLMFNFTIFFTLQLLQNKLLFN